MLLELGKKVWPSRVVRTLNIIVSLANRPYNLLGLQFYTTLNYVPVAKIDVTGSKKIMLKSALC